MTTPLCTPACPIYPSCERKYAKPKLCPQRPTPIKTNLSVAISNMGGEAILIIDGGIKKNWIIEELRLRIGVIGDCP